MTDEEIKALLDETKATILETVNSSISGAVARTQKETDKRFAEFMAALPKDKPQDKPEDKPTESSVELKALQQQLQALQQEREKDQQQALKTQRQNAILSEIGSRKVIAPAALGKLLSAEYGDRLTNEGGKWFIQDGESVKPFSDVVSSFLTSDDGKVFTPPASAVQGSGSRSGNTSTQPDKAKTMATLVTEALKSSPR